jgi:hypothetical protein
MPNKLHTDSYKSIYENIGWYPTLKDTTDLITGTKTITRTSEASGVGNADYSSAQTLTTVPYLNLVASTLETCRMAITRIATRLSVTIDSDDGTHDLRCRVYVDAQDSDHLLYDLTYSTTGNQLAVQACLVATKEIIYNLLKDGSAHTFYFFFWSPGNHSPVISVCQLWYGVGSSGTGTNSALALTIKGQCWFKINCFNTTSGSINAMVCIYIPYTDTLFTFLWGANSTTSTYAQISLATLVLASGERIHIYAGAATDIAVINHMAVGLLREE